MLVNVFSRKILLVIQALTIVMFALTAALIPQYAYLVFILYFIVFMFFAARIGTSSLKKIEGSLGHVLFKENVADKVMMQDQLVLDEMRKQFKLTLVYLVSPLLALLLIPLYYGFIGPVIQSVLKVLNNELLERFTYFIIMYLFLMGVFQGLRVIIAKVVKQPKQLYIPRSFMVYKSGLAIGGRLITFDKDMCMKENRERRFVEIHSKKLPYVIRLYTLEVSKLSSKMKEAGLRECTESEI